MSRIKPTEKFIIGLLLALFFGIALYLRVYLPYDQVFSGEWIKFTAPDAYYHMRLVDNLVHNFPHLMSFDLYMTYPGGQQVVGSFARGPEARGRDEAGHAATGVRRR